MRCLAAIFALGSLASSQTLADRFEKVAEQAQGRVGAVAVVLEGGQETCIRCDEKFPMQSVNKFPIGMAALAKVDEGKLRLQQEIPVYKTEYPREGLHSPLRDRNKGRDTKVTVRELLRLAVSESDSPASDVLMRLAGGADGVMKYLNGIGVTGINVQDTEFALGTDNQLQYRNWMSPRGALQLLRAFHEGKGLSKSSQALLRDMLEKSVRGDRRLKRFLPKETVLAHKTGSSGMRDGIAAATNDIGIITLPSGKHLVVAVFVSDAKADQDTRERVIGEIAKAAWDEETALKKRRKAFEKEVRRNYKRFLNNDVHVLTSGGEREASTCWREGATKLSPAEVAKRLIELKWPAAPDGARFAGQAIFELNVSGVGKVECVRTISGHQLLTTAMLVAIKEWKFSSGEPFIGQVSVIYDLGYSLVR